jgi:hypothetical protein
MSTGTCNEKTETVVAPDAKLAKTSRFFGRKRQEKIDDDDKAKSGFHDDATKVNAPVSKEVAPVGITELFRYVQVDWSVMYVLTADRNLAALPPGSS